MSHLQETLDLLQYIHTSIVVAARIVPSDKWQEFSEGVHLLASGLRKTADAIERVVARQEPS